MSFLKLLSAAVGMGYGVYVGTRTVGTLAMSLEAVDWILLGLLVVVVAHFTWQTSCLLSALERK